MKDKKSIRPTYDQLTTNLRIHTKTFVEKRKRYNLKIALLKGFVDLCRIIKNSQSVPDNEAGSEVNILTGSSFGIARFLKQQNINRNLE